MDTTALDRRTRDADSAVSDADLAAQLSIPVKTPQDVRTPGYRVTSATLASMWGEDRAGDFLTLLTNGAAQTANGVMRAKCILALSVLGGMGMRPSDPKSLSAADFFVKAGAATQVEVDGVFFDISYPAGAPMTADDVAASRARNARADAIGAFRQWWQGINGAVNNELINPADGDPTRPVPTKADALAFMPQS